ncbi:hypothetical protein [Kingella oralis]|uniref:Uncharacterized protein n=1 Tax=Kingella oralis ATCC 51147 TaxID=629741 RepID=C4GIF3_9NEIS|nr:hypothetical protein [Kingella oralis]EEP67575.1 hypothetical protein GCWU000324_01823 [Kingella oralis ATCC 51147]
MRCAIGQRDATMPCRQSQIGRNKKGSLKAVKPVFRLPFGDWMADTAYCARVIW